jgi:hypothetical protein
MNLHAVRYTGLSEMLDAYLHRHNPNYRFWWNAELGRMQYNHRDTSHTYYSLNPITVTATDQGFFEREAETWHNRGRP